MTDVIRGPVVEASREQMILRIPRVGRFVVRAGEEVAVERAPGATDADVRCFLQGPVAAAEALLGGAIPIHASAVEIDGRAVVLAGLSGAGKSGLAAALALRGHALLADAVTSLGPVIEPHAPAPVLWPDLVAQLDLDPAAGELVRPALPQRAFPALAPEAGAAPLGAVVYVGRNALYPAPVVEAMTGGEKATALVGTAWFRRVVEGLSLAGNRFGQIAEIAASTRFVKVIRPRDACSVIELADLVEEAART